MLLDAAREGRIEDVREYLRQGMDVNKTDEFGHSPLHFACSLGFLDLAMLLMDSGALIDIQTNIGDSPLHYASYEGRTEIVSLLVDRGANINIQKNIGDSPLHTSCSEGYLSIAAILIEHQADIDLQNKNGSTSLHRACFRGHSEVVSFLLKSGATIDLRNNFGFTPLHSVSSKGPPEVVTSLLERGAQINVQNNNGATPLHRACVSGRDDIVLVLLENGADCFIKNEDGYIPLEIARINCLPVLRKFMHFHQYRKPWLTIYSQIQNVPNDHSLSLFTSYAIMKILHSSDLIIADSTLKTTESSAEDFLTHLIVVGVVWPLFPLLTFRCICAMAGDAKTETSWGAGGLIGNRVLGSLFLTVFTQPVCLAFWYICFHNDGSFTQFYEEVSSNIQMKGVYTTVYDMWPSPFDAEAWKIIFGYMIFELALMKLVPGKIFKATVTATGHTPIYIANGVQCYVITIVTLLWLAQYYDIGIVYDKMGNFLASMNIFALCFCAMLTVKGLYFPSTRDHGTNGSWIVDFFWGTELYPRIFGFDVKQFTNCRFGMMYWQVGLICYAARQYSDLGYISSSMFVSVFLQSVYIAKFFWWETGYFCSMDIQHDHAGYYICWGCMVWLPSMYTMHTYFLTKHPILLTLPGTIAILVGGLLSIYINYDCDRQRQEFRKSEGKLKIWGQDPEYIVAKYITKDGTERSSLLLASGWWGLARHFHYIPEVLASVFWCVPAQMTYPLPYFYPFYLTILLTDRAWRDDLRCSDKYGEDWKRYCAKVPNKIIPGVV